MNGNIEKINIWIRRHKLFAFSAPIIVSLAVFFVVTSIRSMESLDKHHLNTGAYNSALPGQNSELTVTEPNDIYKKSQKDSLSALNKRGLFKSMLEIKNENDSLERILEELDNFSFEDRENESDNNLRDIQIHRPQRNTYVSKKHTAQEKLEYRNLLMEAREKRLSQSQDYSAPYMEKTSESTATIAFDAAIYRDQFILPGDRVTLILREEVRYQGQRFRKNTFVYAVANLQGARVILEVTNIDNVRMALTALDQEDGMAGLHNQRAGELLHDFKADAQQQGMNELSEAVGASVEIPLAKNLMRSFGNYFIRKKYKQRDKILLVNGDRVFLVPKT